MAGIISMTTVASQPLRRDSSWYPLRYRVPIPVPISLCHELRLHDCVPVRPIVPSLGLNLYPSIFTTRPVLSRVYAGLRPSLNMTDGREPSEEYAYETVIHPPSPTLA